MLGALRDGCPQPQMATAEGKTGGGPQTPDCDRRGAPSRSAAVGALLLAGSDRHMSYTK